MSFFDARDDVRADFLSQNDWADAKAELIAEDWASRRYWRLYKGGATRVLLESVPDDHPLSTPGHKLADTIKIGQWLHSIGIHVPAIDAVDEQNGYALLEDVGSQSLPMAEDSYKCASAVLQTIHENYEGNALSLPGYCCSRVDEGKRRIIDWLLPLIRNRKNDGEEGREYENIWAEIESTLPEYRQTFQHIDYHAENLMWLPEVQGIQRCAVLDFQGAHYGPLPYDLTNLLEDIRRDVPEEIKSAVLQEFCEPMMIEEKDRFDIWYRVLTLQFHCRIAGQLIKLYQSKGNDRYLAYLPRVLGYLKAELQQDFASPIQALFQDIELDLDADIEITPERISSLVSEDAF